MRRLALIGLAAALMGSGGDTFPGSISAHGFVSSALAAPAAPTLYTACVASCSTNYTYVCTFTTAAGETVASSSSTIASGATLSSANQNTIYCPLSQGANGGNVYETAPHAYALGALNSLGVLVDNGSVTTAGAAPTSDTSGQISGMPEWLLPNGASITGPSGGGIDLDAVDGGWVTTIGMGIGLPNDAGLSPGPYAGQWALGAGYNGANVAYIGPYISGGLPNSNYWAIYPAGVTPGSSNYEFLGYVDGTVVNLIGSQSASVSTPGGSGFVANNSGIDKITGNPTNNSGAMVVNSDLVATGTDLTVNGSDGIQSDGGPVEACNPNTSNCAKLMQGAFTVASGNSETDVADQHWARFLMGHAASVLSAGGFFPFSDVGPTGSICPATIANNLATGTSCLCGSSSPQNNGCPDGGTTGSLSGITIHDWCGCSVDGEVMVVDGGTPFTMSGGAVTCSCSIRNSGGSPVVDVNLFNGDGTSIGNSTTAYWLPVNIETRAY